jgi:hypothetical protein
MNSCIYYTLVEQNHLKLISLLNPAVRESCEKHACLVRYERHLSGAWFVGEIIIQHFGDREGASPGFGTFTRHLGGQAATWIGYR